MTGEVIFGGVGAGLYGMLLYCILAVFIAGLMVGRTPEYLGKKIEQKEVKMAMLAVIATAFSDSGLQRARVRRHPVPGERLLESAWRGDREHRTTAARTGSSEILYAYIQRHRQQRQRLRRHQRQHALVQPDDRAGDADRPLSLPDSAAGRGRQPGREEEDSVPRQAPSRRTGRCSSDCWSAPL